MSLLLFINDNNMLGAILTVIAKRPMAMADNSNQVFIFSWVVSGVAREG